MFKFSHFSKFLRQKSLFKFSNDTKKLFCVNNISKNLKMMPLCHASHNFWGILRLFTVLHFLALIWDFWHILTKVPMNHNFFNKNHWDRAYFWSVMIKKRLIWALKKADIVFIQIKIQKGLKNTFIYYDWTSGGSSHFI